MSAAESNLIKKYVKDGDNVLDMGCGDGKRLSELKKDRKLKRAVGGDVKKFSKKYDFEFRQMNAEDFRIKEKFDVIILSHVLEHLKNPLACLERCKEHLTKHGKILIIVPNRFGFRNEAKVWFPEHGAHYWLFDKESLEFLLNGLEFVCRFHPTHFSGVYNKRFQSLLQFLFPKRSSTLFCAAMKK